MRILLTILAFVATYFFVYWVPFSFIPGAHQTAFLPTVGSLVMASAVSCFLWKGTGRMANRFASAMLTGGIIVGTIAFVLGFFGPMIFDPTANQGPLLGILITGPIGFILGLMGGALFWLVKIKKR